jgi:HAD superfamily hydrolase (TIGR01549 family)
LPKAIFFDLDDTLYASGPIYELGLRRAWETWQSWCADKANGQGRCGFEVFEGAYGVARDSVKARVANTTTVHSRLLYFKQLVETLTSRCQPEFVLRLDDAYSSAFSTIDFEPARQFLRRLAPRYPLGLMTNQICVTQMRKLIHLDPMGELFRWMLVSEEVGAEKPSPVIFQEALRRSGLPPEDVWMVGDSWRDDIMGARAAGMRAVHVAQKSPVEPLPAGVQRIPTLFDLEGLL